MGKTFSKQKEKTISTQLDLVLFQSFVQNHPNPIILVKHHSYFSPEIIFFNNSYASILQNLKESELKFSTFLNHFSFYAEPVNILASKEKIKALLKKTGEIFEIIAHRADQEHVMIEMQKKEVGHFNRDEEYYELVNLLPEIIFELNNDLRFSFLNKKARQVLKLGHNDDNSDIHVKKIILKKDYARFEKYLTSIFEGKTPKERVISIVNKEQKIFVVEVFFSLIRHGVKIKGIRGIAIDITHRKKIEERLLSANMRIEDADKLKTIFLMNMSHEIRTPLNSVLGYTQLLQRKTRDPEFLNYLQNIRSSGKRLLNLFNDLIDLSKIYAGQLDILPEEVNLNKLIDKLRDDFITEIEISKKPIVLKCQKAINKKNEVIVVDRDRLIQVFTGLFNNALKFTVSGSIEFGCKMEEENILFFMKDTGEGLDDNLKDIVFKKFFQVQDKGHFNQEGVGIGLSIIKGIVDKMGGRIWVESAIGMGAGFYFTLPVNFK